MQVTHKLWNGSILPSSSTRNESIEILRIISCFCIIWFHSAIPIGHAVSYAGLGIFLFFTGYFFSQTTVNRTDAVKHTAVRLLVPWGAWSAIYATANIVKFKSVFQNNDYLIFSIMNGPSSHLWYLPYVFFAQALLFSLNKRLTDAAYTACLVAMLIMSYMLMLRFGGDALSAPLPQYIYATPLLMLGILFGKNNNLTAVLLLAASCGAIYLTAGDTATSYIVAIGLSVMSVVLPRIPVNLRYVSQLSSLTLGIYLVHPLCMYVAKDLLKGMTPVTVIVTFILAAAATFLINKTLYKIRNFRNLAKA